MTTWPVHARIDGPIVMIGFGSIGKGTLPLIERHFAFDKSRLVVIDPDDKDRHILDAQRHPLHPPAGHQGALPASAHAAPHRRSGPRLLRQSLGRHLVGRHHGAVPRARRASTSTPWSSPGPASISTARRPPRRARTTRCARPCLRRAGASPPASPRFPAAAPIPAWCRGSSSRRCSTSRAISGSRPTPWRRARTGRGSPCASA